MKLPDLREAQQRTKALQAIAKQPGATWSDRSKAERAAEEEEDILLTLLKGWPQPNKYGVYSDFLAEEITFASSKNRAECEIHLLQIETGWIASRHVKFNCGSFGGSGGGLMCRPLYPTREAALKAQLDHAIHHFVEFKHDRNSCSSQAQHDAAVEMAHKLSEYRGSLNQTSLFPETGNAA